MNNVLSKLQGPLEAQYKRAFKPKPEDNLKCAKSALSNLISGIGYLFW